MNVESYYQKPQRSDAHSASAISPSPSAQSDSLPPYRPDHKRDPGTTATPDAEVANFSDSITPEDAYYFRKEAATMAAPSKNPGGLPEKSKRKLQPQSESVDVVPDENPLNSKFLNNVSQNQNVRAASTAVDEHLPGQAMHANQHIKGGTWKHGLCDCGDVGVCCTGLWCPCIIYGKTQYRLSQRSERKDPTSLLGYSTFNGSCIAFAILCGCNLFLAAIQHSRLRETYDIPGNVGSDFGRACCCCCCTLSQDEKEIKLREGQARRPSESMGPMQYISPMGMDFSAPPN